MITACPPNSKWYISKPIKVRVNTNVLNIRPIAGSEGDILGTIIRGRVVTIIATCLADGWCSKIPWGKLKNEDGWICLEHTEIVEKEVNTHGTK